MNDLVQIVNEAGNFVRTYQDEIKLTAAVVLISAMPLYYGVKEGIGFIGNVFDGTNAGIKYEQRENAQQAWDNYLERHNFNI